MRRTVVTLFALTLVLGLAACPRPAPKKSESLASRIKLATGNVQLLRDGAWVQAIAGLVLPHGSEIKVGSGDRALVQLDDGSSVFLRHGSHAALTRAGLLLKKGEAWVDAPRREKTPARYRAGTVEVSASAAGLDLKVTASGVEVYVARGLAVVSSPGGRSEVQSGEKAVVAGDKQPKVEAVAFWEDWTGGMPDRRLDASAAGAASGTIYAIDRARPGSPPQELEIRAQAVRVVIRDGVARTTVDQRFFNPSSTPMEGYYWFTIPEGAAVDRFALDVNGTLMEGEMIERKQAKATYEAAVRAAVDPALLEWVDGRTFRARIFPIPAAGERRVVISYMELLPTVDGRTHYVYPMGGADTRIQEFALEVSLGADGEAMKLATTADARVEQNGRRVTVRRSGYRPQGDFLLEMVGRSGVEPLRAMRVNSSRAEAAYVMLRYTPDVAWDELKKVPGRVVVVVDTSAGGDDADRQLRSDVAEAILRGLSTDDKFALVAVDLTPRVLFPQGGLVPADEANIGKALEVLSGVRRAGATDLGTLFDVALKRLHGESQPAVVYIGDGRPTVGERSGESLSARVTRSFAGSTARLYTIASGAGAQHALLGRLARIGGGQAFRVDRFDQSVQQALRFVGHLKTPTLTDLELDLGAGLDQVFSSAAGKVSRGQEVTVLARTHHPLPDKVKVTGKLGGKPFSRQYPLTTRKGKEYAYVPGLWARRYLDRLMGADLDKNRGTIIRLGLDYALMTPFSSFLVLDSVAAYRAYGITPRRRDPLWGLVPRAALETAATVPLALFGCSAERSSEPTEETASAPVFMKRPSSSAKQAAPTVGRRLAHRHPGQGGLMGRTQGGAPPTDEAPPPSPSKPRERARDGEKLDELIDSAVADKGGDEVSGLKRAAKEQPAITEDQSGERLKTLRNSPRRHRSDPWGAAVTLRTCSDLSRRSLAQRREVWRRKLARSDRAAAWVRVYRAAAAACELPHWRDKKEMLDLIQGRVTEARQAVRLLRMLPADKIRAFVQRRLLRRAVSPRLAAAAGDPINWTLADAALAKFEAGPERMAQLKKLCKNNPLSVGCALRLIRALSAAGQPGEALATGLKVHADGLATPELMQVTGDLLAEAGRTDEARRAYSEIVEFSPDDPTARLLLGDIFLRHGWYADAYRQYKNSAQDAPDDALAALRLAAAAAGAGRVDEALRLERKVAAGEGEPGPDDPRRWARFLSASRIARLLLSPKKLSESIKQSMERALRRLQLLTSPGVLVLLTWEDLAADLGFSVAGDPPITDAVQAPSAGLASVATRPLTAQNVTVRVQRNDKLSRAVPIRVTLVVWDGKTLKVAAADGKLVNRATRLTVPMP